LDTGAVIAVAAAISGIALGWLGRSRTIRKDTASEASKEATLQTDMAYVKRGIDDMRVDIKLQGQQYNSLAESVIRIDESVKSAHKRIDRLEAE